MILALVLMFNAAPRSQFHCQFETNSTHLAFAYWSRMAVFAVVPVLLLSLLLLATVDEIDKETICLAQCSIARLYSNHIGHRMWWLCVSHKHALARTLKKDKNRFQSNQMTNRHSFLANTASANSIDAHQNAQHSTPQWTSTRHTVYDIHLSFVMQTICH